VIATHVAGRAFHRAAKALVRPRRQPRGLAMNALGAYEAEMGMGEPVGARADRAIRAGPAPANGVFAAIDLGTNNCRLLIATRARRGFRILDAFSRIVRLGEGLSVTGRLADAAMERAVAALGICAERMRRRGVGQVRAVATQACRVASNGRQFVAGVAERTGIELKVISPKEEARLAVAGCASLIDPGARAVLVLDVGGGSTEISWLDLSGSSAERRGPGWRPRTVAWLSLPIGVVTLAERFPDPGGPDGAASPERAAQHFAGMVEAARAPLAAFAKADGLRGAFAEGAAHIIGTSGAITSLAGLHLRLPRYERRRVDSLWMSRAECEAVTRRLMGLTLAERAREPCIGPGRADLVLAGAALLSAVQSVWPCERVRVADRGLREGLLLGLMADDRRRPRATSVAALASAP